MRPQNKRVCWGMSDTSSGYWRRTEAPFPSETVQGRHVGKYIVQIVRVRWIQLAKPILWKGKPNCLELADAEQFVCLLFVNSALRLGLVIDAIKANDSLQKYVQLGVTGGILCNTEKGLKDVFRLVRECKNEPTLLTADKLFKAGNNILLSIYAVKPGNLYEPAHIIRKQLIVANPCGKLRPFIRRSPINRNAVLGHLVLAGLQVRKYLCDGCVITAPSNSDLVDTFGQLGQVRALDVIIGFQKDFSETALSDRIVFQVEVVKTMKRIFVGLCV